MREFNADDEHDEQHDMVPAARRWQRVDSTRWVKFDSIERVLLIEQGWTTAEVDAGYALMVRE